MINPFRYSNDNKRYHTLSYYNKSHGRPHTRLFGRGVHMPEHRRTKGTGVYILQRREWVFYGRPSNEHRRAAGAGAGVHPP